MKTEDKKDLISGEDSYPSNFGDCIEFIWFSAKNLNCGPNWLLFVTTALIPGVSNAIEQFTVWPLFIPVIFFFGLPLYVWLERIRNVP